MDEGIQHVWLGSRHLGTASLGSWMGLVSSVEWSGIRYVLDVCYALSWNLEPSLGYLTVLLAVQRHLSGAAAFGSSSELSSRPFAEQHCGSM